MKAAILGLALLVAGATAVSAQTATFTWSGSTDSSQPVELATIDGQQVNQSSGYAGEIQIVNGRYLWLLDLPESFGFPNNGFLDCGSAALLTLSAKQWYARVDGTMADGTKAGDEYGVTGTTSCSLWNGAVSISITEFRQMVQRRSCGRGICKTYLADLMTGGTGVATVH